MAAVSIDTFGTLFLTDTINAIVEPHMFIKDLIFGLDKEEQLPNDEAQFDVLIGGKKLAPFVGRDQPAKVIEQDVVRSDTVKIPRIRVKKGYSAKDLTFNRGVGLPIHVRGTSDVNAMRDDVVTRQLAKFKRDINRSIEWLCTQALTGTIAYAQDDYHFDIDYLMPAANKPTAAVLWSESATADPLGDIEAWKVLVEDATGFTPRVAFARHELITELLAVTAVTTELDNRRIIGGNIDVNKNMVNGVTRIGELRGVTIYQYNETYVTPAGVTTPMIADNVFIMAAPDADNRFFWGAVEDLDAGVNFATPFFSKDYLTPDPSKLWVLAESAPLPVLGQPDSVVYATVS